MRYVAAVSHRLLLGSAAVTAASAACAAPERETSGNRQALGIPISESKNPRDFGALGDGMHDDTAAFRQAYEALIAGGGGVLELPQGNFYIPGGLEIAEPGISVVGFQGARVGGGELTIGPREYEKGSGGVDFTGTQISGIVFDGGVEFGAQRCLVLRNVRGLDIQGNVFTSAEKGIAVEGKDGNEKFHTSAMLSISRNRFTKLVFGIYADTKDWDVLSDWSISDNYFNYCSDTSVWIASASDAGPGGVDGLNFAGNTIFSLSHNAREADLFKQKRYNLRLGQTNWLRIINNNFFEAGLAAVLLDNPINFTFVGNHVAWPGQRALSDAVEIRNGKPAGVIEGNTFADWTHAAVGLYDLDKFDGIEVGQNSWTWRDQPTSWTGNEALPGYRVFASEGSGTGRPVVRDFHPSGSYDSIRGGVGIQSRDIKTPTGGVSGVLRRGVEVSQPTTVFVLGDIADSPNFGGVVCITATDAQESGSIATYLLFLSAKGEFCKVIESAGDIQGGQANHPSFSWDLAGPELRATPIGSTGGSFNFDAVAFGAVSPK